MLDIESGKQIKLLDLINGFVKWLPDSQTILYSQNKYDDLGGVETQIYLRSLADQREIPIFSTKGWGFLPLSFLDNQTLLYFDEKSERLTEVRTLDLGSGETKLLQAIDVPRPWEGYSLSPDQTRLLVTRLIPEKEYELIDILLSSGEKSTILTFPYNSVVEVSDNPIYRFEAQWLPDSRRLLVRFPPQGDQPAHLGLVDGLEKGSAQPLLADVTFLAGPSEKAEAFLYPGLWSPDGQLLTLAHYPRVGGEFYILEVAANRMTRLPVSGPSLGIFIIGWIQSTLPPPDELASPTPDPSMIRPPACQFEGELSPKPELPSQLNRFVFSEPKVIFSREAPIEIIEWLPDNQQLLVHILDQTKQSIEVLDTATGQTQVYASNLKDANRIHWIAEEKAVVYTDRKTFEFSGIDQYGVWLSRGEGQPPQLLLEDANLLKAHAGASQLTPGIAKALNVYDFSFDPERWRYNKYPENSYYFESWREVKFASSVNPDGSKALFYGVPWFYLVDLKTNQPCEVDLGKTYYVERGPLRVFRALWSPDGKLLAMQTAIGYREELIRSSNLVVLNTITGKLFPVDSPWNLVLDMNWFPDSRYLVVRGYSTDEVEQPQLNQQIGIVDSLTQEFRLMLPDRVFAQGSQTGFQLALSPSGKSLAVNCPIVSDEYPLILKGQVCLIIVD